MPAQPVPPGITSTKVTSIPHEWDREWFKQFIVHHLLPGDSRSVAVGTGLTITNYPNTQKPPLLQATAGAYAPTNEPFLLATAPGDAFLTQYRKLAVNTTNLALTDGGALGFMTINIVASGLPNAALAQMATLTLKGNNTGGAGPPLDLTVAQVTAMLPPYPVGANPTAVVGTAAVAGVATTFTRSDGAPAIDLTMAPAWTGSHSWTKALKFPVFTVATLPANSAGLRAMVSDALAPAFGAAVAGGGAVTVPVYNTGAGWFVG